MRTVSRRVGSVMTVSVLTSALLIAGVALAPNAAGAPAPIAEPGASNVTADALPTVQIDGVVWSQAIVGDTVYAGGNFSHARPAGSPAGQNQTTRTNLLAYSISTGAMITSFAPTLDGQVKSVVASPDGSRIYVGGQFTKINGVNRYRIAAFSTATRALITTFAPPVNYTVNAIAATDTTVYAGGAFSAVGSSARGRLAAFSAATGALLTWSPSADAAVTSLVLTPSGSKLIAGGAFQHINGGSAYGLGAINPGSGALVSWAANTVVRNAGQNAAIESLSTDGTAIYGSGYVYGSGGNLEGAFSANPETGAINWIEDCHGDTYGVYGVNGIVYTVSHAHFCGNVGGFPQTNPWTMHRGLAWTANAAGTVAHNSIGGYFDWFGKPAPALYNWFPDLDAGTFTGLSQAAWEITGNGQYVVMGGEFPKVNNTGQQGLVRFAVRPTAPGVQGPRVAVVPTLTALSNTGVRVSWQTSWDRDNEKLTYRVIRNDNAANPVFTTTATSQFWNRPTLTFTDTGLASGAHYNYKIYSVDPFGNTAQGSNVGITTGGSPGNQPPVPASVVIAADSSGRTVNNGWGSADTGGAWTVGGVSSSAFSVTPGAGRMQLPSAGAMPTAYLDGVAAGDSNSRVDFSIDKAPVGSSYSYAYLAARHSGTSQYWLRTKVLATGVVQLSLTKVLRGAETVLTTSTVSGLTFSAGQALRMRLQVSGTSPVALSGKLWVVGASEPAGPLINASDTTSPLGIGGPGLAAYAGAGATNVPITVSFANLSVGP